MIVISVKDSGKGLSPGCGYDENDGRGHLTDASPYNGNGKSNGNGDGYSKGGGYGDDSCFGMAIGLGWLPGHSFGQSFRDDFGNCYSEGWGEKDSALFRKIPECGIGF